MGTIFYRAIRTYLTLLTVGGDKLSAANMIMKFDVAIFCKLAPLEQMEIRMPAMTPNVQLGEGIP
jgi:hypothetical protein